MKFELNITTSKAAKTRKIPDMINISIPPLYCGKKSGGRIHKIKMIIPTIVKAILSPIHLRKIKPEPKINKDKPEIN